ncbi:MAG: helix-turn-helix domain-containing protein [Acidobacteriaceae bacterium]
MALNLLRGKWRIEILLLLLDGPVRLGQLRRRIPGATKKMLVQRLREMEREGIITRTDLSGKIKRVEYTVCDPVGVAVLDLLVFLAEWSTHHLPASILNDGVAPAPNPCPAIAPDAARSSVYRRDSQPSASLPLPVSRAELPAKRESA